MTYYTITLYYTLKFKIVALQANIHENYNKTLCVCVCVCVVCVCVCVHMWQTIHCLVLPLIE